MNLSKLVTASLLALGILGATGVAHAEYLSKDAISNRVTAHTGAAQSTVTGFTENRAHAYVRSEGTLNGEKYVKTRFVNSNSGAIVSTGSNILGQVRQQVALKARNGAVGGEGNKSGYSVKTPSNAMPETSGNVKTLVVKRGEPSQMTITRISKSGSVGKTTASGTGNPSRW